MDNRVVVQPANAGGNGEADFQSILKELAKDFPSALESEV